VFTLLLLSIATGRPETTSPTTLLQTDTSGVYYRRDGGDVSMRPATVFKANVKGLDNYIYTGGYTNLDMNVSFAGTKALLRVRESMPVFIVRPSVHSSNIALASLALKKNQRVCRTSPSDSAAGNKYGLRKANIIRTIVTENPDKSFSIKPERPLKPGEYLLITDSVSSGYDFGVD